MAGRDLEPQPQPGRGQDQDRSRGRRPGVDLRLPVLGLAAWAGALGARLLAIDTQLVLLAGAAALWLSARRRWPMAAACLLVLVGVAAVADLRSAQVRHGPVADLAADHALVAVVGSVAADPRRVHGRFGDQVVVRVVVHQVSARGSSVGVAAPVLVLADVEAAGGWEDAALGTTVAFSGRLGPADDPELAAFLDVRGDPRTVAPPGFWWRGASAVRAALRDSVAHRPAEQRAIVPALVDGDDAAVPPELADDFRTTGLTHLLAVSGTNLTLVVGFLLGLARWGGVRGRWLLLVGAVGIVGFVLLARTEPSVLRAAVMGTVGLLAMTGNGRARGLRALGGAVVVLLLLSPGLAVSPGFALSVLATLGILVLGPPWRDALGRWLPSWLAEAVAVPAAAQLACTPLVAAISGQVSLVAVVANLVAGPVVGPATVSGLLGGLLSLVWTPLGRPAGTLASWCVAWIVLVAHRGAALPTAAVDWGTGARSLAVLVVLSAAAAVAGPVILRRRSTGVTCCLVVLVVVCVPLPSPGWPPPGWVMAACDVGQGDGLVLNAGDGAAVVVDAGPDPRAMDRCLRRLDVESVPLVVLTHFHADHVDGLAGVFEGREVGAVETTRLADPPGGVAKVRDVAAEAGLRPQPAAYGSTRTIGDVTIQALWPLPDSATVGPGDGSTANEASVVLLAVVGGVRLLLTGDVEPEGQVRLARSLPGLRVDVLKMPHHGSRYQDEDWLLSLRASVVLVSVGADNDYGQPSAGTLDPLAEAGAEVVRTDQHGDLVVVAGDGGPEVRTSR